MKRRWLWPEFNFQNPYGWLRRSKGTELLRSRVVRLIVKADQGSLPIQCLRVKTRGIGRHVDEKI